MWVYPTGWLVCQLVLPSIIGLVATAKLAKGSFIAFNRDSGATRAGKLF
jgi:hypothetical protein